MVINQVRGFLLWAGFHWSWDMDTNRLGRDKRVVHSLGFLKYSFPEEDKVEVRVHEWVLGGIVGGGYGCKQSAGHNDKKGTI